MKWSSTWSINLLQYNFTCGLYQYIQMVLNLYSGMYSSAQQRSSITEKHYACCGLWEWGEINLNIYNYNTTNTPRIW
jgi:hypothetical protein